MIKSDILDYGHENLTIPLENSHIYHELPINYKIYLFFENNNLCEYIVKSTRRL